MVISIRYCVMRSSTWRLVGIARCAAILNTKAVVTLLKRLDGCAIRAARNIESAKKQIFMSGNSLCRSKMELGGDIHQLLSSGTSMASPHRNSLVPLVRCRRSPTNELLMVHKFWAITLACHFQVFAWRVAWPERRLSEKLASRSDSVFLLARIHFRAF